LVDKMAEHIRKSSEKLRSLSLSKSHNKMSSAE
jgi:hypothetical protein